MKHTIIVILIFISTLTTAGHDYSNILSFKNENKCKDHEIGINLYNITEHKQQFYLNKLSDNHNFVNGIMYKRHYGKNAIRVGFYYYYSKFSIEESGQNYYYKNEGQNNFGEFRIGYERKITTSKLQPYFALDLSITFGNMTGISGSESYMWWYTESPYTIRIDDLGISPSIGLKYQAVDRFSFSIETSVNIVYYHHKYMNSVYIDEGAIIYLNPLQLLSMNYHF
ncbi:MAG: hypothetical protein K8S00_03465 [Bacteroidales bacterium]|nr:hypothetical protein [Bacteroidales bacterium]